MPTTQLPLFPHHRIPARHLTWLKLANAGSYALKPQFYQVKNHILEHHGLPDGQDLQTIIQTSHTCGGSGTHWTGNPCYHCTDGIYRVKHIRLFRYLVNDCIFHNPGNEIGWCRESGEGPIRTIHDFDEHKDYLDYISDLSRKGFKNHFRGLIRHAPVCPHLATRAAMKLFRHYLPDSARWLWKNHYWFSPFHCGRYYRSLADFCHGRTSPQSHRSDDGCIF